MEEKLESKNQRKKEVIQRLQENILVIREDVDVEEEVLLPDTEDLLEEDHPEIDAQETDLIDTEMIEEIDIVQDQDLEIDTEDHQEIEADPQEEDVKKNLESVRDKFRFVI